MSEYQYYEFVAIERPLTDREIAELRAISTRAEISHTGFRNEYNWGDLKADSAKLLAQYFDAHLYFANWGTRRLMFRLPASRIDLRRLKPYFPGESATLKKAGDHVVIDLRSDTEEPEESWCEGSRLGALVPLRSALLQGDLSPAYLAWLSAVQSDSIVGTRREPVVPAGLRKPSALLSAMAEFLRIDRDLIAAAVEGADDADIDSSALHAWLKALPVHEKDRWLVTAVDDPERTLGTEIVATYRRQLPTSKRKKRTIATLLTRAEELRAEREKVEARQAIAARRKTEEARRRHLAKVARQGEKAWQRLDKLVSDRKYEEAVKLTLDLYDVAVNSGQLAIFEDQMLRFRKKHSRRRGYLDSAKRELKRRSQQRNET